MPTFLLDVHNILRWAILVSLILSIVTALFGWKRKKELTAGDARLWLITMILAHLQLVIGLAELGFGRYGIFTAGLPEGVHLMKDHFYRSTWVEHPVGMILAIVFITLARGQVAKPISDIVKYRRAFWMFLIAMVLILAVIPR